MDVGRSRRQAGRGRRGRARIIATAIAVTTASAFVVGSAGSAPAASSPKQGGEVTYGLESETGSGWCPSTQRLAISGIMVATAIYDTLTVPNSKGEIVPYLAKSITSNDDSTEWVVTLREGVTFHDGTPVDATAVKGALDAHRQATLTGAALKNVTDVRVDTPTQLTITTGVPWPELPWALYFDGRINIVAPAQLADPATCPTNLIGSGPFKKVSYTPNQELVTERNPNYWQKDAKGNQLPYLDKLTFKPVAEAAQRTNSLSGGQLDIIHTADGQQVDALEQQASNLTLMREKPGRREVRYYLMNTAKPPLDDLNARKAIAMAIDREQINELRNNGLFAIPDGPFDTAVDGYLKNPGYPKYNPKQAKKLADAYKDAHGGEFSVVLEHTNDPANVAEADIIKQQLAKVGIDATLKQDDQTAFVVAAVSGNFSIMLWRQHPGSDPDQQYPWWQVGSTVNFGKFDDPELQALLDQGRAETDPAARKKIYEDVNRRFAEQVYNVWAYNSEWVVASNKSVKGLAGPPLPDKGGKPIFLYGRHPLLGISVSQ
jgi:peptide/nickel transport system substrate-binding protein